MDRTNMNSHIQPGTSTLIVVEKKNKIPHTQQLAQKLEIIKSSIEFQNKNQLTLSNLHMKNF